MTISGALSNAISGLRAAGRGAEVVSSNISNALTPGYGRRVLGLAPASIGDAGGVQITGIYRIVDASLLSDLRLASAEQLNAQGSAGFFERIEGLLSTPDDPSSLTARYSGFENALVTAASRPDAPERLSAAVAEAMGLIEGIRALSDGIQEERSAADRSIGQQVNELNSALGQVVALNAQITASQVQGGDVAALQDQRQQIVNRISELVPVREAPRDNGQIALYSIGGAVLVDGTRATIGFTPTNVVTPYMSLDVGTLSGLTINGVPVRTGSDNGALKGGAIASNFAIRDELGVATQGQADAIARDLISRFQDPAVDPSLAVGDAGLFTDAGSAFDPINEQGLSLRLRLNAAVDPDQGGQVWRIRDGVNAVAPGDVGDASLLQNLVTVVADPRMPAGGGLGGGALSAIELVSNVSSGIAGRRTIAEQELSYAASRLTELTERQLAEGVDTDAEIARLLLVEQSYAANARIIEAVDEMLQTILRI